VAVVSLSVAAVFCPSQSQASGLDLLFEPGPGGTNVFSGTGPTSPGPWVDVTLKDSSPGTVVLTISNLNIASSEKITELYLNLNPSFLATSLVFSNTGGSSGVFAPLPSLGLNMFKADGDGKYDILFDFGLTPSTAFSTSDYLTYTITGIPTLTSSDFEFLSQPAGGHGPFYAALHVQGINITNVTDLSNSGWVSAEPSPLALVVPEPASAGLLLFAAGLGFVSRNRFMSKVG
jgi:hypothetical protein